MWDFKLFSNNPTQETEMEGGPGRCRGHSRSAGNPSSAWTRAGAGRGYDLSGSLNVRPAEGADGLGVGWEWGVRDDSNISGLSY